MAKTVIGIAIKQGKAQLQRITYNAKGTATIEALSGWITLPAAQALREQIACAS